MTVQAQSQIRHEACAAKANPSQNTTLYVGLVTCGLLPLDKQVGFDIPALGGSQGRGVKGLVCACLKRRLPR